MATFGGDTQAKIILENITQGIDFTIPDIDLSNEFFQIPDELLEQWRNTVTKLSLEDLTTREVNGSGVFDALMESVKNHIREEYDKNRITGAEYTKAYTAITESAISNSVQFLLQRDQAYWAAVQAQIAAITSNVQLANARVQLAIAQSQAHTAQAEYALTTMKLATEDAQFALISEQEEAVRGQTLNVRRDGSIIVGSIGVQKDLYNQQIVAYQRDSELKASKIWSDMWTVLRTIDEGYPLPTVFDNTVIDTVLQTLKTNNSL